jgi:hypothetical protein
LLDLTDIYKHILESEVPKTTKNDLREIADPNPKAKEVMKKKTKVIINPPLKETALKIINSRAIH